MFPPIYGLFQCKNVVEFYQTFWGELASVPSELESFFATVLGTLMIRLFLLFSLLCLAGSAEALKECNLHYSEDAELSVLMRQALQRGCTAIEIDAGEWHLTEPILLEESPGPITIGGNRVRPVLTGRSPLIVVRRVKNLTLENLLLEGNVELEQTENTTIRDIIFVRAGIFLTGKKCNQPNECTGFNRHARIEGCSFENATRGIRAERIENSVIEKNRFTGSSVSCTSDVVSIDLDGSSEDLDRRLELGHNKGNRVVGNSFEHDSAIGIRVRDSWANTIEHNHFTRPYRAMEFQQGARHNQVLQSYITYLSQQLTSASCPPPCAIYLAPGSVNNIFWNNFFEQNFELQFLETNRNRTFVIDESGDQNVFRSDFQKINR
jgi:parallel beta-helix repeat protein